MSPVLRVDVPIEDLGSIFKAAEAHIDHEHESEGEDLFTRQNPAAKKLTQMVSETYDAMAFSMLKEIFEVLGE